MSSRPNDGYGGHFTSQIDDLTNEIRELVTAKGWRSNMQLTGSGPANGPWFAAYLALIVSEVMEALEAYRAKSWSDTCEATEPGQEHHRACSGRAHGHPKPVGVGPELADTFIRVLDTSDIWGIDLQAEVRRVLDYGKTREYQHGGKIL